MGTELPFEYCCKCGEPTGRAGRGDDSIYIDVGGQEVGPLCVDCCHLLELEGQP